MQTKIIAFSLVGMVCISGCATSPPKVDKANDPLFKENIMNSRTEERAGSILDFHFD